MERRPAARRLSRILTVVAAAMLLLYIGSAWGSLQLSGRRWTLYAGYGQIGGAVWWGRSNTSFTPFETGASMKASQQQVYLQLHWTKLLGCDPGLGRCLDACIVRRAAAVGRAQDHFRAVHVVRL